MVMDIRMCMTIFHRKKKRKNKKLKKIKGHSDDFGTKRGRNLGAFHLQR